MHQSLPPLSENPGSLSSQEGRRRLTKFLNQQPYPHYEKAASAGLIVRIDSDGTRTLGQFVNRQFQAVKKP